MSTLGAPIESLEGIGETRAKVFHGVGVHTLGGLLDYFPRDYQFESSELAIRDLTSGPIQTARGEVTAVNYAPTRPRPRFEATIDDGTGKCGLVWFHGAYLRTKIHPGLMLRAKGKVRLYHNMPQMTNPKWEEVAADTATIDQSQFRAIYPASGKLTSEIIGKIIQQNLKQGIDAIQEWFEPEMLKKRSLLSRSEAYRLIHQPPDLRQAMRARRRLIYDELMLMQLGLGISKRMRDGRLTAPVLRVDKLLDERIGRRFPFVMTDQQRNAVYDIIKDVQSGRPMNRLLQGDVGSGKTAVAVYAMLMAVANRMQAAILAPTEVLAEQHYLTLGNLLRDSSVSIELITSRTRKRDKGAVLRNLAEGKAHLAVGTQAMIQEKIEFANLGLVVVDEQHKLGVRQRAVLKGKGLSPHYLVMTATPIPRTLALSYFADFDVSTIEGLPPGRHPIETRWMRQKEGDRAYAFIRQQVALGRQAYIVLPQIDDDGLEESRSVLRQFEALAKGPLKGLRLSMLHGQMSTEQKQETMGAFRDRQVDVLIATTVIEVGIDVPNATVILIDHADAFGLSQLHQLRGRVGRGGERSYCLLLADPPNPQAQSRLNAMTRTGDGFKIAEMDLQLRGPGHFFGTQQHGLPEFKLADITSEMELLQQAKDDAMEILSKDPKLERHPALKRALAEQLGGDVMLAQIG